MPEARRRRRPFWEDALNLPNALTSMRILLIPVVLYFMGEGSPRGSLFAAYTYAVTAITDALDGYLARSRNLVSMVGQFLDPLADKLLVMATLIYLVRMDRIAAWIVVVLIGREISVTGLRSIASGEGLVIAAGESGKWKAALQMVGILCLILHYPRRVMPFWPGPVDLGVVGQWLVLLSLVFSVTSAIEYGRLFASAVNAREQRKGGD